MYIELFLDHDHESWSMIIDHEIHMTEKLLKVVVLGNFCTLAMF